MLLLLLSRQRAVLTGCLAMADHSAGTAAA